MPTRASRWDLLPVMRDLFDLGTTSLDPTLQDAVPTLSPHSHREQPGLGELSGPPSPDTGMG